MNEVLAARYLKKQTTCAHTHTTWVRAKQAKLGTAFHYKLFAQQPKPLVVAVVCFLRGTCLPPALTSGVTLTWTIMEMIMGSMDMGNRRMLKREMETKALSGSRTFATGSDKTYVAKVTSETK